MIIKQFNSRLFGKNLTKIKDVKSKVFIQKILFPSPSVEAGKEQDPSRNDFVSLTGKPIGEGAFGDVWKVRHKQSSNVFAIKCILKSKIIECKMQEQLNREVRIMYSLNHPHIIKLVNHFEDNEFCYLILELAPNGTLWTLLNRRKTLDEPTAAQCIREVSLAVEYLHNKDPPIIHRDIKPENILLDTNNSAKLCDFGWSNFFHEELTRKTYCGTLDYLAPEMIKKQGHDTKLDMWNIGVLLYELLTGTAPFQAQTQKELFEKISKVQINWPKGFSVLAKDLISKLLRAEPSERLSIQDILNHRWMKSHAPIRQTIQNDLTQREKLPLQNDNAPLKETQYAVLSVPQTQHQEVSQQKQLEALQVKHAELEARVKEDNTPVRQQLAEKDSELLVLQSDLEEFKKALIQKEILLEAKKVEGNRYKNENKQLNNTLIELKTSIESNVQSIQSEVESIKSEVQKLTIPGLNSVNQVLQYCTETTSAVTNKLNQEFQLVKQLQTKQKEIVSLEKRLHEKKTGKVEEAPSSNVEVSSLRQQLEESEQQTKQYKEQLNMINKFWELDKNKVEDLKKQIQQYESIVSSIQTKFK